MSGCATGCGRPTRDVLLLCEQCGWELEFALGDDERGMAALVGELETTLTWQARLVEAADGGRSAETPLAFHAQASEILGLIRTYLVGWVRDLADDDASRYPTGDVESMAAWLLDRINELVIHPAANEVHGEIVGSHRDGWRVVDRAANRTKFTVGPCPEMPCLGQVWAYIPSAQERPARLECDSCGVRWETHQWLRAGKRILARRGSSTQRRPLSRSV